MTAPPELVVAEYQSLRAEILQNQQVRLIVLGLVLGVFGTATGIALSAEHQSDRGVMLPGLVALVLLLITAAVHLTSVLTQRIDMLSGYIRQFIERPHGDLWETRWTEQRRNLKAAGTRDTDLPLGTSKALAHIYLALIIGTVVVYVAAGGYHDAVRGLLVIPTLLGAAVVTRDLHQRRSPRWANPFEAGSG
jgi:hypothetical protein